MDKKIVFILNDREVRTSLPAGTALVDFIRDDQRLTGTRVGCREGDCGACTVLLGMLAAGGVRYRSMASCLFPLADAAGCHVVTVEGLNRVDLTPVQQAIVSEGASQCGFCTPGLVVSLSGFLLNDARLLDDDAVTAIEGNVCRCTGYASIRRAVERLLRELRPPLLAAPDRLQALVGLGVFPAYFPAIAGRLRALPASGPGTAKKAAMIVAGGTDLYVQRGPELPEKELQLLSRRGGFAAIWPDAERIFIGAAATVADMMESALLTAALPRLPIFLRRVSSTQVRNRATVGGNIVNASPIGDLSVMLLALDAVIGLRLGARVRELKLREFFLGYKKLALRPGEVAAWVSIPVAGDGWRFHFEKVARREQQDIASVNSAIGLQLAGGRIAVAHVAVGGVAPVPLYLKKASALLVGREVSPALLKEFL
ncbi:MAG: FAD binding domain-containing protein, partial [Acidobacteria bacterium]|nr:FAD binding domain-containing protein [Acidobacteriota bacterium]